MGVAFKPNNQIRKNAMYHKMKTPRPSCLCGELLNLSVDETQGESYERAYR